MNRSLRAVKNRMGNEPLMRDFSTLGKYQRRRPIEQSAGSQKFPLLYGESPIPISILIKSIRVTLLSLMGF